MICQKQTFTFEPRPEKNNGLLKQAHSSLTTFFGTKPPDDVNDSQILNLLFNTAVTND